MIAFSTSGLARRERRKAMLARYNPIDIERALRTTPTTPPFPPITDRAAWDAVRKRLGEQ